MTTGDVWTASRLVDTWESAPAVEEWSDTSASPGERFETVTVSGVSQAALDAAVAVLQAQIDDGAPDVPGVDIDVVGSWGNVLGGGFNWGTGATAVARWIRMGRGVLISLEVKATADHDTGLPILPQDQLPYLPAATQQFVSSGFAFVQLDESSGGAGDGTLIPLGPAIVESNGLIFVQMSGRSHDGTLGSIWATDGLAMFGYSPPITADLTGRPFSLYAGFMYEASTARTP